MQEALPSEAGGGSTVVEGYIHRGGHMFRVQFGSGKWPLAGFPS